MKCPICGKELELKKKQIGTDENGDPILNEYAICRDCRKQWNLDRQRAKKAAAKSSAPEKNPPVKKTGSSDEAPAKAAASDAAKGNAYEAVEEVSEKLLSAREAFLELVDRTIEFLDVSKASFDASDKAEAASVTKK